MYSPFISCQILSRLILNKNDYRSEQTALSHLNSFKFIKGHYDTPPSKVIMFQTTTDSTINWVKKSWNNRRPIKASCCKRAFPFRMTNYSKAKSIE